MWYILSFVGGRKMKKLLSFTLAAALVLLACLSFAACNGTTNNDGKYLIGICQITEHPALDAATQGFKDALIEALGADKVEFDYQSAQNETTLCPTIINTFVNKNVDLILANATPALTAAYNTTTTIPILGTSITEYGTALGLENFSGTVGGNVSGTSDLAPLDQQAEMIKFIFPEAQKVALLYCSAENNSKYQVKKVAEYLAAMNIETQEFAFADTTDVTSVTSAAAAYADVIYVPTDNTVADNAEVIYNSANGTPIIAGEEGICSGCGVATLSISYYDLGVATGKMAAKILKGEAKISEMPIEYAATFTKKYNPAICEELGVDTAALEAAGYVAIPTK